MAKARPAVSRPTSLGPHSSGLARAQANGRPELILDGRRYRLVPVEELPGPAENPAGRRSESATVGIPSPTPVLADLLTARELQIVSLVAEGRVNKQIAGTLRISEWTVSTHLRRIFAKLGVETRAAMVSRCLRGAPPQGTEH
jgi:DNA-binding CsgD family transcriptional regulator